MSRRWFIVPLLLLAASAAAEEHVVQTLDARRLVGEVNSLDGERLVVGLDGETESLSRENVLQVRFAEARSLEDIQVGSVVLTAAGGEVHVDKLSLAEGTFRLGLGAEKDISASMESVRAVILPRAGMSVSDILTLLREREYTGGTKDRLVVERKDGSIVSAEGVLVAMDEEEITFRYGERDRTVARESIRAIWLAELGGKASSSSGVLTTREGSHFPFVRVSLDGDKADLDSPAFGELTLLRDELAEIRFASDRRVALSEMEPETVEKHGLLGEGLGYRVNRAAGGGPLRLGGETYHVGLGMHSFCELTWELDEPCRWLVARVGIDDAVRPAGDAVLIVERDGEAVGEPIRLTGKDRPQTLRVELDGAKSLTLRVEFGPDGVDVGDRVTLAEAYLIR